MFSLFIGSLQEDCVSCSQVPQELEVKATDKLQDIISILTDSLKYQASTALFYIYIIGIFVLFIYLYIYLFSLMKLFKRYMM